MTKETITRTKLTAAEGMILTNGETYGKEIYLSVTDKPANWHEISVEEYEKIKTEQENSVAAEIQQYQAEETPEETAEV